MNFWKFSCTLLVSACLAVGHAQPSFAAQKLTLTNKLIDGKKVWEPSSLHAKAGEPVELKLINTLPDPHGFNLPGLADNVVVGGKETKTVTFTPKQKGEVKFNCQLHPAHVGGELKVD